AGEAGVNIPNLITTARLVITVLVFVCLQLGFCWPEQLVPLTWGAFVLFLLAAFSDFLDGYLARKWNLVTAFGRVADPFADKILITGSLIMLLQFDEATDVLTAWFVVVVVAREFLVTAVRGVVEASGQPFPADRLGKYKMVAQCWTVGALMTMVAGTDFWVWAAVWGYWVSLVLTVVSGANYVYKARKILFGGAI
ncbi:MAG: CDP-diacylglycerol--glycerol-3-phosphate 3-phosphatidyltransferase, partial [Planctomycetes bacterium]|nr:CDP-diacylglycerol--glycerol-3-phosphate 3-phosphatidyltransferase [Planctomycetota bacterium]